MSNIPLTDTILVVERSVFHSIRQEVVDKGYYPDTSALLADNITAINQGTKEITIGAINRAAYFTANRVFSIIGSTGNDTTYTVVSSVFNSPDTIITVAEAIADPTADGKTSIYKYYDDDAGVALLKTDVDTIVTSKGFAIEVFGVSAPRAKYQKRIPRIVIIKNQFLPGDLGGAPDTIYTPNNGDILAPDAFTGRVQPPQTVNYNFDLHLVCQSAQQSRVLHGITALAVPKRGYIDAYELPGQKIFVNQYSYRSMPNTEDNLDEDIYMYTANDIFESEDKVVAENIKPITEITIEQKQGDIPPGTSSALETFVVD